MEIKIKIDQTSFDVDKDKLSVKDILILGGKPKDNLKGYELIRVTNGGEDILYSIAKKPKATLNDLLPINEGEVFIIRVVSFIIIVNAVEKEWPYEQISYQEIIESAFGAYEDNPNITYTVSYFNGPKGKEGSLVKGNKTTIQNEMAFTVTRTDKS